VSAIILISLRAGNIIRYIPNSLVGIVDKMCAAKGSIKSGSIALRGEAGFEPEICEATGVCCNSVDQALFQLVAKGGACRQGRLPTCTAEASAVTSTTPGEERPHR